MNGHVLPNGETIEPKENPTKNLVSTFCILPGKRNQTNVHFSEGIELTTSLFSYLHCSTDRSNFNTYMYTFFFKNATVITFCKTTASERTKQAWMQKYKYKNANLYNRAVG